MLERIKRICLVVVLGTLGLGAFISTNSYAINFNEEWLGEKPEWSVDVSLSTTFLTKYIWRGWNLGDEPVMQFDGSISKYGITIDVWGNYSFNNDKLKDLGRYQEITELDYNIDYTFSIGDAMEYFGASEAEILKLFSISLGYTYYTFPNVDLNDKYFDSHEAYCGLSYDCLLQPSVTWYWDVENGKGNSSGGGNGSYFLFETGHTFDFEGGISADVGITTGYNNEQWTNKSGWSDMVFSGGVNILVANYFMFSPTVSYSLILDRDTFNDTQENEFYGGVGVSFNY